MMAENEIIGRNIFQRELEPITYPTLKYSWRPHTSSRQIKETNARYSRPRSIAFESRRSDSLDIVLIETAQEHSSAHRLLPPSYSGRHETSPAVDPLIFRRVKPL